MRMPHPPLWARWLPVFAVVIAAIAIAVRSAGTGGEESSSSEAEPQAAAEANRVGQVAIAQDEAPHSERLPAGVPAQRALQRAVQADVRARITHGELTGPLQAVSCRAAGAPRARDRPFACNVRSAGLLYPFVAVLDERALRLTWCKVDAPPVAHGPLEVPVSARCRA
jgi:hypothetical protein